MSLLLAEGAVLTQMSEPITKSVLPNGLRVITERMPHVRTAAMGLWVNAGSRYEAASQHGISHFLEHLFFKGTQTRSALEIAQAADEIGGQMNAFTDREQTVFYVKVLAAHFERAVEIVADMLLRSTFAPEHIERERQVIDEEIKSYEDSPDELVQDLFAQTVWDGHALGRPVIGTLATVNRLTREDLTGYVSRFYHPTNVVVSVAGDVVHDEVTGVLVRHLGGWNGTGVPATIEPPRSEAGVATRLKETEQVHLCLGAQGLAQADERRYTLSLLDHLIGGGMSSRLFQEIRERRGLVYTIASYATSYRDGGLFVIYAGMSPDAGPEVIRLTLDELERIRREPVDAVELNRAKESLKGSLMLSLESTGSRMSILARSEIYHGRQITLDELITKVDAVSAEDLQRMAAELLDPRQLSMAAIGPFRADGALAKNMQDAFEGFVQAKA
jgi:predicted Zn-dependent peptidase